MEKTNSETDYTGKILLKFTDNPKDIWTVDDATKGISIMGGTGSGKTSASGKQLAHAFLREGWGGLVLCAKSDEAGLWKKYCVDAGRENDLIIFKSGAKFKTGDGDKEEKMVFNPIDYEMKRSGDGAGQTQNITNIFMNVYRMGNRIASEGDTHEERYWDTALKRCLNRVIELIKLAKEDLSYSNMVKIISSSDNVTRKKLTDTITILESGKKAAELEKKENYCLRCLANAYANTYSNEDDEALDEKVYLLNMVEDYFTNAMPAMGEKTKSVVTESFMGLAEPFLSGLLYEHFSGVTNILPEWTFDNTYDRKKIIVLDLPIKEFLDAGIIAQSVFKLMFQQAIERRDVSKYPTPVFLWCDEAQYFINPYDQIFLTTARSSRTATVFLSQNISNYFAVIGSGSDAKARVNSLMGNLCTKIFHANSDAETNEYASRMIGNDKEILETSGEQYSAFSLTNTYSQGANSQYQPQIQPRIFTILKTGGYLNDYKVNAILAVSGKEWSNGKNYLKVSFTQNFTSS